MSRVGVYQTTRIDVPQTDQHVQAIFMYMNPSISLQRPPTSHWRVLQCGLRPHPPK